MRVRRPVVRSFKEQFVRECAAWVRSGGHAVLWASPRRARLVVPPPDEANDADLGLWSMMDLGKSTWNVDHRGTLRGLAVTPVPRDCLDVVRMRAERDSVHRGPFRTIELDCLECGACCRSNEVVLEKADLRRFDEAGRPELYRPPYAIRKRDGRVILRLKKDGRCKHLGEDNMCAVYTFRPEACREFPAGSECCLWARYEELDLMDGAPPSRGGGKGRPSPPGSS